MLNDTDIYIHLKYHFQIEIGTFRTEKCLKSKFSLFDGIPNAI